jgi:FkbM family methyltransferase
MRPAGVVTIRHGAGQGLRIFANDQSNVGYALGTTEAEVQRFLTANLKPGDVCFDIGANVGFFTLIAARLVGDTGRVYAFEPLPSNAEALRRNIALNGLQNVEVIEAAVSERSGTAELVLGQSSLDARLSMLGEAQPDAIAVRVISLDDFEIDGSPSLVKIDAEGAEYAVLSGMRRVLASTPVILCELHQRRERAAHLAAVRAVLGEAASRYTISLLEDGEDWWAPHVVALPLERAGQPPAPNGSDATLASHAA